MFDGGATNSLAGDLVALVVPDILGVPVLGAATGVAEGSRVAFFTPKITSGGFATFPPATVESPTPEDDPGYWREVAEANGVVPLASPSSSSLELSSSMGPCRTRTRTHHSVSLKNTTRREKANLGHFSSHP